MLKEIEKIEKIVKITERNKELKPNKKVKAKLNKNLSKEKSMGITLIALIITIALNCLRSGRKLECVA